MTTHDDAGYYEKGQNETVIFDVFSAKIPTTTVILYAGLDQVIDYIKNLNFTYEDVDYLSLGIFQRRVSPII